MVTRRVSFPPKEGWFSKYKYSKAAFFVGVSDSIVKQLENYGIASSKLSVIHSAIDGDRFLNQKKNRKEIREELGISPEEFIIGIVGNLAPHKGHEVFMKAWKKIQNQFSQNPLFFFVGEGELRESLEKRAKELKFNIKFTGFQQDIPKFMTAFDLLVLPSVSGEGSPAVIKEAWAAGTPVIATDSGGIGEIIENGVDGWVVPAGEVEPLAGSISEALSNPESWYQKVEAGREKVKNQFTIEVLTKKIP